jgi:hypothetical protein
MRAIHEAVLELDGHSAEVSPTAIWRSKDSDCSVIIVGDLGVQYVSVQNTHAGIPLDEFEPCSHPHHPATDRSLTKIWEPSLNFNRWNEAGGFKSRR